MTNQQFVKRVFSSETILRNTAVEIARFACNGGLGRSMGDPVFDSATANRGHSQSYSASGDLPHFVLKMLGVRDPQLVRPDVRDGECLPWTPGKNLARIMFPKTGLFIWAKPERRPNPGDFLYTASPEHVSVLEELDEYAGVATIFEYGRREPRSLRPAGFSEVRRFQLRGQALYLDSSKLRGWFDVTRIPGLLATNPRLPSKERKGNDELAGSRSEPPASELTRRFLREIRNKTAAW